MGDAAAQQQQTPAFFAAFPPTSGRKEVGDLSQLHHGSIRTLPLGKLENLVRTDKVPLAVFLKRCGCQVAFQVDFCICFGKALELCFVGDTANINLSRLIDEDALSKRMGEVVYNNLKDAVSRGDKPPKPREPDGTFLDVLDRATTEVIVTLKNMNGTEYLNRVYARPQDGLGSMFNNVRYGSMSASTLARASRLVACWDQTRTTHSRLVTNTTSTRVAWTANGFLKDLKMIARQSNIYKNTKKAVQAVVVMKLFNEHHGAGQQVNGLCSRWELNAVGACVGGLDNSKQKAFIRAIRDAALRYVNDQCPVAGVEGGDSDGDSDGDGDGDGERDGDGDIFGSDSDSDSDSDGGPGEDGEGAAEGSVRNNSAVCRLLAQEDGRISSARVELHGGISPSGTPDVRHQRDRGHARHAYKAGECHLATGRLGIQTTPHREYGPQPAHRGHPVDQTQGGRHEQARCPGEEDAGAAV